jgi:cytochrome c peroxidase
METLEDVVRYFNNGRKQNQRVPDEQLSSYIRPLGLSEEEIIALTRFLENGLKDPDLKRYVPENVLSGMCFPNNDRTSRIDMDCY